MKKIKEITKGKAKSMFTTENDDYLVMHFSDDTSAFDGKKKEALLGKGAVNNQFNAFIMNHLEQNGVETHLIEVIDATDSLVYKLEMFPIECVIRNRASGSICKRLGTEDGLILENPLNFKNITINRHVLFPLEPFESKVSIPLMMTNKMRMNLRMMGYTDEELKHMRPEEGWEIIKKDNLE